MQHPQQRDVATPLRLAGDFVGNAGNGIGRPDDLVLAHGLEWRVSRYCEAVERRNADPRDRIGLRGLACNRNLQVQMLALNELSVTDTFSTARNDSLRDCKTRNGNAELRRGQP